MDISNPKRILVLSTPDDEALATIKELTGSAPTPIDNSIAGLNHTWTLKTSYYTADLNIWIDDISDHTAWGAEFKKDEAKEVIDAIGAWIYIFRKPVKDEDLVRVKTVIGTIKEVIHQACGEYWDGTCLAIGTKQSTTTTLRLENDEAWEDFCREQGCEYIDAEAKGRNEFGEPVGLQRLKEALETTEWEGGSGDLDDFEELDDFGEADVDGWDGLAGEQAELNMELLGMKSAVSNGAYGDDDEAAQVEEMERMMGRLMAIKDTTSAMPEAERQKFAAKAVKDFMKDV